MIKFPELIKLVSYHDNEVHLGTIYKAANWKQYGQTTLFDWNVNGRKRNKLQSESTKTRWEYNLKQSKMR